MPTDMPPQPPGYHRPAEFVGPHDVPAERRWVHPLTALQALVKQPAPLSASHPVDALYGRTAPMTRRVRAELRRDGSYRLLERVTAKEGTNLVDKGEVERQFIQAGFLVDIEGGLLVVNGLTQPSGK